MSQANSHKRLVALVAERQLAEPTADEVRELEALLQSASARRLYIELINLEGHLETLLTRRTTEDIVHELDTDEIFAVLRQAEDAAPDVAPAWQASAIHLGPAKSEEASALTLRDTAAAVSYLVRQQTRRYRVQLVGLAAMLIVGVVLALSFLSGPADPNQPEPIASAPQGSTDPAAGAASVATLTATHNAKWAQPPAEGASAPGSYLTLTPGTKLHPGTRLTLTAGFAEITTNDGAIAILEAPCVVELKDNDNALRLVSGKLVGICETPSSKGFLVRTPHMDVVDLGTRFGVDASQRDQTDVVVFEGVVHATRPSSSQMQAKQETLHAGGALRATAMGVGFQAIDYNASRFAGLNLGKPQRPTNASEAGINRLAGQVRWVDGSTLGNTLQSLPASENAFVFEEVRGQVLGEDLPISIHEPGVYNSFENLTPSSVITKGTMIRSYIVILQPENSKSRVVIEADLGFDGEVLGVVATKDDWHTFMQAVPGGKFGDELERNIVIEGGSDGDFVEWNLDRQSLKLRFSVSSGAADAVRVIVREPASVPDKNSSTQ